MTLNLTIGAFALLGALSFMIVIMLLRRSGWPQALFRGAVLWLLLGVTVVSLIFAGALYRWHPVVADQAVKTLIMTEIAEDEWRVVVQYPGGGTPRAQQLRGEFLEVEGHLLALDGIFHELGFPPLLYSGELVRGGYFDLGEAVSRSNSREEDLVASFQSMFRSVAVKLPMVRTEDPLPGYVPLRDQAVFDIVVAGHRLQPVPANDEAEGAWREWVEEQDRAELDP